MTDYKTRSLKCPQCGGRMDIKQDPERFECPFCGYTELVKTEDSEERRRKAEQMAYSYTKGRLDAQSAFERQQKKEGRRRVFKGYLVAALVLVILFAAGAAVMAVSEMMKPSCDPFEYVSVTFSGTDGQGNVRIEKIRKDGDEIDPSLIRYKTESEDLYEGGSAVVTASSDTYRLTSKSRTYTVSGLDLHLKSVSQLTDEILDFLSARSGSYMERDLKFDDNMWGGATLHIDGYTSERCAVYVLSDSADGSNEAVDVYRLHMTKGEYESDRYYALAYMDCTVPADPGVAVLSYRYITECGSTIDAIGGMEQIGGGNGLWGSYAGVLTGYYSMEDLDAGLRNYAVREGYDTVGRLDVEAG